MSDKLMRAKVGDIWRFHPPNWNPSAPVAHYLIMELSEDDYRNNQLYVVLHLETGKVIPDLLLDEANFFNYAPKQVG